MYKRLRKKKIRVLGRFSPSIAIYSKHSTSKTNLKEDSMKSLQTIFTLQEKNLLTN